MSNNFLISQTEFATLMGVSKQAVSKAIKDGRVTLILDHADGKMKLNADLAAKQWRDNTSPRVENSRITNPFLEKQQAKRANDAHEAVTGERLPDYIDEADLLEAKTEKERLQVKLLELQFKEKTGELISAEKAKREYFKIGRLLRDAILNVPSQICNELAADSDPFIVHQKLSLALTKALEALVNEAQKIGAEEEPEEEEISDLEALDVD